MEDEGAAAITLPRKGGVVVTAVEGTRESDQDGRKTPTQLEDLKMHMHGPLRPIPVSHHSSSLPSTPYQHARKLSDDAQIPPRAVAAEEVSPSRSAHSESDSTLRQVRRGTYLSGCKYETGLAFSRRRIPYSLGGDKLERATSMPKKYLDPEEEDKLSGDMRELYDRLLPTSESEQRRERFIKKVERLLNKQWPGNEIQVHVFGSSGNMLYTNDSDVDLCITTPLKALERVCLLAKALAESGMERVVCIPTAKVPIVKMWDPELQLSCDLNVNNTLALENTRMIKTYVEIDDRVRPLAMIIKHWTRNRILNDAALGGTLSSYTWICMILNFLQSRNPPVLPSLHKRPHQRRVGPDGKLSPFADDVESLKGYGKENKETLGDLLFHFFRRYGHEIDYERNVISVREGTLLSKQGKKWHLMQNNRLCVEEPFNTERNLGNTADDISFRGVHLEMRRAFEMLADGKFEECFEQFVFPPTAQKVWEKPPQAPRPILSRSVSQSGRPSRGGSQSRGGGNVGRQNQPQNRNGVTGRRASSAAAMGGNLSKLNILQNVMHNSAPGLQIHDQLYSQFQLLQAQEAQLRLQMQQRAHAQLHANNVAAATHLQPLNLSVMPYSQIQGTEARRRHQNIDQAPLSAPMGQIFFYPPPQQPQAQSQQQQHQHQQQTQQAQPKPMQLSAFASQQQQTIHTNPSSPSMSASKPLLAQDPRRGLHRGPIDTVSLTAVQNRSRSQPATIMRANGQAPRQQPPPSTYPNMYTGQQMSINALEQQYQQALQNHNPRAELQQLNIPRRHSPRMQSPLVDVSMDDILPKEYVGYYMHDLSPYTYNTHNSIHPIPTYYELAHRSRGISPEISRLQRPSRSPSPSNASIGRERSTSFYSPASTPSLSLRPSRTMSGQSRQSGPIIADGSGEAILSERQSPPESIIFPVDTNEASSSTDEVIYTPLTRTDSSTQDPPEVCSFEPSPDPARNTIMPSMLQFGDFPARSTLRAKSREAALEAEGRASHGTVADSAGATISQELPRRSNQPGKEYSNSGLGIQYQETQIRNKPFITGPIAPIPAFKPPKATVTQELIQREAGKAPLLSPVREVRTPSPTILRKEDSRPPLQERPSHGRSISLSGPSPLANLPNGRPLKHPEPLKMNGQQLQNGIAGTSSSNPTVQLPVQAQTSAWQQTTGKKGRNKKAKIGTIGNINGSAMELANGDERKGG
ncbi:hypothetical protein MMC25_001628 [Agyrium rufum]|nr:hypothetical protein [Agyrium rufum]